GGCQPAVQYLLSRALQAAGIQGAVLQNGVDAAKRSGGAARGFTGMLRLRCDNRSVGVVVRYAPRVHRTSGLLSSQAQGGFGGDKLCTVGKAPGGGGK